MSQWVCIPSARPVEQVERWAALWRLQGYKVAIWRESMDFPYGVVDYLRAEPIYPGYAMATNALAKDVLETDSQCDWIIAGGDDVDPDPNHTADEIARECSEYFDDLYMFRCEDGNDFARAMTSEQYSTFGVMQPTGDRFAGGSIDRIAGSPWMGRAWCERINQGRGPLWPDYLHVFADEELQNVAIKYGVFWQRPELIHLHHHFQRESDALDSKAVPRAIPPHLIEANSKDHWYKFKTLFNERTRTGFPGSEPL